jgi:hypothetical protein
VIEFRRLLFCTGAAWLFSGGSFALLAIPSIDPVFCAFVTFSLSFCSILLSIYTANKWISEGAELDAKTQALLLTKLKDIKHLELEALNEVRATLRDSASNASNKL